eukprot:1352201-Rhodomonas_salina.1
MCGAAVNMHSQGVVQGRVGGKRTWSTRSSWQREASSGSPSPAPSPSAAVRPLSQHPHSAHGCTLRAGRQAGGRWDLLLARR